MKTLKNFPKNQAKVIPVTPKFLLKKDAMAYIGMKRTAFDEMISKKGLSIYAYGRNKIWYKISELDEMMESLCIKKKANDRTVNNTRIN
jgi:hypothetical protein